MAVIDAAGRECPRGVAGDVALHSGDVHGHPDPVIFLGYWKNDAATRAKSVRWSRPMWCCPADSSATPKLIAALQQHVKAKLVPYEYPKEIEFIEALPMTTTGKVQRKVLRLQKEARAGLGGGT